MFEEIAFIAYYFHWPLQDILDLEHKDRRQWVEQVTRINQQMNGVLNGV
jgi:hypothetical protein